MTRLFLALALSTALTAPAFAETMVQDVTCTAFLAMGHDDMMATMTDAMAADAMATDGAMAADATAPADGAMATDATAPADGAMAADGAMSADDQMAAMVKACTAHPDMMAMDAMNMMN